MIIAAYNVTGGKGYITGTMLHEALGGDLCVLQADRMLADSAVMVSTSVCVCVCVKECVCMYVGVFECVCMCAYACAC